MANSHRHLSTLALRTKLLHADQIRYMYCFLVGVPRISRSLKIVKFVQHPVAAGVQRVLQWSHVTQVACCFSVLATVLTVSFITFVIFPRHEYSTLAATTLTLANASFLRRTTSLVIIETCPISKVSIAFFAGDSDSSESARRTRRAYTTRLIAYVRHVTPTTFVARLT